MAGSRGWCDGSGRGIGPAGWIDPSLLRRAEPALRIFRK
jgi:hypothetical protein